jgi:hypothetical protein
MPVKTYTRTVETIFTRDEIKDLLQKAHAHCKDAVKPIPHRIGRTRRRTVKYRKREEYLNCIKQYIYREMGAKLGLSPEQVEALVRS